MKKKDKNNKVINVEVKTSSFDKLKVVQGYLALHSKPSTQNDAVEFLLDSFDPNKQ